MHVLVAQIDARRHYAVPRALFAVDSLARLETTLCARHPLVRLASVLPRAWRPGGLRRLLDRQVTGVPDHKIASSSIIELRNLGTKRASKEPGSTYRRYVQRNSAFGKHVVRRGFAGADAVYAFNGAAVEIFRAAKHLGLRCFLDQTLVPLCVLEPLLAEERERFPGWEMAEYADGAWRQLAEREAEEWQLADKIICGSAYVATSVANSGAPADACEVVPYDPPQWECAELPDRPDGKLKVLYAGTICLRKGIQYLVDALAGLGTLEFEARAVGPIEITAAAAAKAQRVISFTGPCQRSHMNEHFRWADVLVLPSLAEGSANVTYEALASGVPVITTENSGSIVCHDHNGWIVPARDSGAITQRLRQLGFDRELLFRMAENAFRTSRPQNGDNSYGARLLKALGATSV